jgi:ATP-dependent helicase/nuclease subunit B
MSPATLHILPSTAAVEAFNRAALACEKVLFGSHALTLKRLAEELFRAGSCERRAVSAVGRRLLLEKIVQRQYAAGKGHFAPLRDFPGFVRSLEGFIDEMKQALLTDDELAAIAQKMPRRERMLELAALYRLYSQALADKALIDSLDAETFALRQLQGGGELPPIFGEVSELAVSGIYDFTPLQSGLITELARRLPVTITFPYEFDRPELFAYVAKTVETFEALDNPALQLELRFTETAESVVNPVLSTFFSATKAATPLPASAAIELFAAPGAYRECEEIGRLIRRKLEQGVDPASIAVLFRDTAGYGPLMEEVCHRFQIPVSYRRGAPLFSAPLIHLLLAPFELTQTRYGREELLALLKASGFPPLRDGGGRELDVDLVEEVLLAARYIDDSLGTVETSLARLIKARKSRGRPFGTEERVAQALKPLLKELRQFDGKKTLQQFTELLERFIKGHRIYQTGIETGDPRALKRDASAITLFQKVLGNLEDDIRLLGLAEERLEPAEFVTLLRLGMEGEFLAGERSSGVTIMNFHDARALHYEHLIIGGLNEGVCPPRHDSHPLFKDSDKQLFNKICGSRCFRLAVEKTAEEPLLFYLAMGCAGSSLTLSYSYADSSGNALLRSPFLEEVMEAGGLSERRIPLNRPTPALQDCLEREELLSTLAVSGIFTLPAALASHATPAIGTLREQLARIAQTAAIEAMREEFFSCDGLASRAALSTPYTGTLRRSDILAALTTHYETPPGNSFAPTSLEEYGCCPFRYFLKRLVRLAPLDKPELELEVKDEGSLVHEILKEFFQGRKDAGRLPLTGSAEDQTAMGKVAAAVFAQWEAERYTGERLLWEVEKGKLLTILAGVVAAEADESSALLPQAFELPFPGLEVKSHDGATLNLSGKIDRVDLDAATGTLRVVDYKMAANAQRYGELLKKEELGETSFQMPVYLLAAADKMNKEFNRDFTGFIGRYWLLRKLAWRDKEFTDNPKEDFSGFFATDPTERLPLGDDNFLNRLCAKVSAMKQGDFQITPRQCEFCDFASVCRYVEVGLKR